MKFDLTIKDATKDELISILGVDVVAAEFVSNTGLSSSMPETPPPAMQQQTPPMPQTAAYDEPQPDELDKNGLPWDLRIHSDPAKINADGSWRAKRGVEKELGKEGIAAIELELRNSLQTAPAATQQQTPPMPQTTADGNQVSGNPETMPDIPAFMDRNNQATPPPAMQQQTPPPAMQQQTPPPAMQQQTPPPATNSIDFHTFMTNLSNKMITKDENGVPLASPDYLATVTAEISNHFGEQLAAITDVSKDQNMIDFAVQILQRDGRW